MFSEEVADLALAYLVAIARHIHIVHRGVQSGEWPKPQGLSLRGKRAALVGYGNIGRQILERLTVCGLNTTVYDPFAKAVDVELREWPDGLEDCDFIIFACALTDENRHMLSKRSLEKCKFGVRIINVSRGPLIEEAALIDALDEGKVAGAALDVFEIEPLPDDSKLREFPAVLFGSHNASNTQEAVEKTNAKSMSLMRELLDRHDDRLSRHEH